MREVKFLDSNWYDSIELLQEGKSVFLSAPEHYGKGELIKQVLRSEQLRSCYTIITLQDLKDSSPLDFQSILNYLQSKLLLPTKFAVTNQYEFAAAVEEITNRHPLLLLINNTHSTCSNTSIFIDILYEITRLHHSDPIVPLLVLITDDYSMHFFENNRVFTGQSSAWYFEKINIRRLKDCSLIKEYLLDFFHNKQLTDRVGTFILKTSGGHQGLIRETLQHIFEKWESINFDTIEEEIQQFISDTTIIDEFRADYTSLNTEDLQLLYSFRNKKLFETNEGELVRKFVSKGILTREGDLYISISPGIIGDILKTIYQTRTMAASKKLVLCVHGLAGSEQTWRKFEELYKSDRALQQEYDFATFEYPTSKWWNFNLLKATNPAIKQLADGLDTEIKFRHNTYKEIALVCHSMGGLVGRKYLLDKYLLKDGTQAAPTIKKIIMYATPHLGSSLANIAKYITIRNNQVKQLARNSDFLGELNDKWISTGALDHYKGWYVIGGLDQIVPKDSSQLYYGNKRCQTILNADHFNCNSHYLIGQ